MNSHRASVETIQTYYADVEVARTVKGVESKHSARYWRTPDTVRAIEQTRPGTVTDVSTKGGRQLAVTITTGGAPQKDGVKYGARVTAGNRRHIESDPWEFGLYVLPLGLGTSPPKPVYSLEEAVRKGVVRRAEWTTDDGRRLVRLAVDCDEGGRTYEVWVDPAVNWMIRRCVQTM